MSEIMELPPKDVPKALLGLALQRRLAGQAAAVEVRVSSPWDVWWVAYRAALPFGELGLEPLLPYGACRRCTADALECAAADPPRHPDDVGERLCGCLRMWAVRIRSSAKPVVWPCWSLTIALIKPGAPAEAICDRLAAGHDILNAQTRMLTPADARRMYPDAYGEDYIAAVDAYLTSAPVHVLLLRSRAPDTSGGIKMRIRAEFGGDRLHNFLHMPDNPGEALADIAHLAGWAFLQEHERFDDDAAARLAFYRTALGVRDSDADSFGVAR
ncbi:hypothetical protein ACFLIM_29940 [Nonomuraea sp. M3C6]|uniref:Nucleoside diphosphate kinase n=1 Tax=Nonomuraea marmarensis TaxID=3351344 RepID=A0ABW7AMC3_9ACTN